VTIFGPDCSSFQGQVDWHSVARSCAFGWEKATEGTGYVNPRWAQSKADMAAEAKASGFIPGAYLFLDYGDGAAQADWFAQVAGDLDGWAIAVDGERAPNGNPTLAQAQAAVARLRQHYPGHVITGYTPQWYWGSQSLFFVDVLWASHYVSGTGTPAQLYAKVDGAWWDSYGGLDPELLQFTSSATIPGVSGPVDCSAFRGTPAELAALILPHPPPTILEDTMRTATYPDGRLIIAATDTNGNVFTTEQAVPGGAWAVTQLPPGGVPVRGPITLELAIVAGIPSVFIQSADPMGSGNGDVYTSWREGTPPAWQPWAKIA
jgi:lysozyme